MAISGVSSASDSIRTDYMNLLVTQLQNQNPLEPMDNNEMSAQLTQLSSLEQLENMSSTFQAVLASQQRAQAVGLIGKEVEYIPEGAVEAVTGRVEEVDVTDTGARLTIGEHTVDLDAIRSIRD